jgi:two-component system, OmpR family, sensor kinase
MARPLPLRTKLNIVYGLVVASVLVVLGLLLYITLYEALLASTDQTLIWGTQQVRVTLLPSSNHSLTSADVSGATLDLPPIEALDAPGLYVRVFDAQGNLLGMSSNLQGGWLPVNQTTIRRALAGHSVTSERSAGDGRTLRIRTTPIVVGKHVVGALQVGQSLEPLKDTMFRVRNILLALSAIALLASATIGWFVSKRGLRPLTEIAAVAASIRDSGDFGQRLKLEGRSDEVGTLASSFNALLGKVEETLARHRQFVAGCSHELRTPLLIVRGNLDLLTRVDDPAEWAECLSEARAEAARMQRIVADLLVLAQVERAQVVEFQPVRLDELLREVYHQAQPRAGRHTFSLSAATPVTVLGDRERLKQIAVNLVENAVHYTPEGGSVMLGLDQIDGMARFWVRDSGVGIAPEEQERIFEPFYRANRSRAHSDAGAGLGLSIVRYLAEAHGGRVSVESQPGTGSIFTVYLPLPNESHEPAAEQPSTLVSTA